MSNWGLTMQLAGCIMRNDMATATQTKEEKSPLHKARALMAKMTTKKAYTASVKCFSDNKEVITEFCPSIVSRFESGEIHASKAISEVLAVLNEFINNHRIENALAASAGSTKKFLAIVTFDQGQIEKRFDLPQQAERWAHLRLLEFPHSSATILHKDEVWSTISRNQAFFAIPGNKQPYMKKQSSKTSNLSWAAKAAQTQVRFSKG